MRRLPPQDGWSEGSFEVEEGDPAQWYCQDDAAIISAAKLNVHEISGAWRARTDDVFRGRDPIPVSHAVS